MLGAGGGISDHHPVEEKIRYLRRWRGGRMGHVEIQVVKVNDLDKVICKMYYKDKLKQR